MRALGLFCVTERSHTRVIWLYEYVVRLQCLICLAAQQFLLLTATCRPTTIQSDLLLRDFANALKYYATNTSSVLFLFTVHFIVGPYLISVFYSFLVT
jgi:hypothetical protein